MDTIFTKTNKPPLEKSLTDANILKDHPYEEDLNKKSIFKTPTVSFFQQKGRWKIYFMNQGHGFITQKLKKVDILDLKVSLRE